MRKADKYRTGTRCKWAADKNDRPDSAASLIFEDPEDAERAGGAAKSGRAEGAFKQRLEERRARSKSDPGPNGGTESQTSTRGGWPRT